MAGLAGLCAQALQACTAVASNDEPTAATAVKDEEEEEEEEHIQLALTEEVPALQKRPRIPFPQRALTCGMGTSGK
jgi:hypothetical protein